MISISLKSELALSLLYVSSSFSHHLVVIFLFWLVFLSSCLSIFLSLHQLYFWKYQVWIYIITSSLSRGKVSSRRFTRLVFYWLEIVFLSYLRYFVQMKGHRSYSLLWFFFVLQWIEALSFRSVNNQVIQK